MKYLLYAFLFILALMTGINYMVDNGYITDNFTFNKSGGFSKLEGSSKLVFRYYIYENMDYLYNMKELKFNDKLITYKFQQDEDYNPYLEASSPAMNGGRYKVSMNIDTPEGYKEVQFKIKLNPIVNPKDGDIREFFVKLTEVVPEEAIILYGEPHDNVGIDQEIETKDVKVVSKKLVTKSE